MNTEHERVCYACGHPAEAPFLTVHTRTGGSHMHKGAVAVICTECAEKIEEGSKKSRRPDAPV